MQTIFIVYGTVLCCLRCQTSYVHLNGDSFYKQCDI